MNISGLVDAATAAFVILAISGILVGLVTSGRVPDMDFLNLIVHLTRSAFELLIALV